MIESCNRRRMLIGIALLGGLTLIVLIVESHWTSEGHNPQSGNTSDQCWHSEKFDIVKACHPCTDFEIASKSVTACVDTKFKEVLQCEKSGRIFRSCEKVAWIEERHYWVFESVMFAVAVISYSIVYLRQKVLNRRARARVQRQLASGLAG